MKTCKSCQIEKEIEMYDFSDKDKKWRRNTCRKCRNEKNFSKYLSKKKEARAEYMRIYMCNKKQNDPVYRIYKRICDSIRNAFRNKGDKYIVENYNYTKEELMAHIEKQFTTEMNWENRGSYWEIDHIIPAIKMLRAGYSEKEINKLSNIRPLTISDNRGRSKKYEKV